MKLMSIYLLAGHGYVCPFNLHGINSLSGNFSYLDLRNLWHHLKVLFVDQNGYSDSKGR